MKLYDQHVHSRHSFDSRGDPDATVRGAISKGLAGVSFTEHFDTHPSEWGSCIYDDRAFSETVRALRERYGESIFIGKGIEVCYQPGRMDFILDFLGHHDFDVVLLSVHYFGDEPVHGRERWAGITPAEGTRRYFETVLGAVRACEGIHRRHGRVFDVLGHLDLVKRYTNRFFGLDETSNHGSLIDEILGGCLVAGLVPEVNTSTLRQGLSRPMPSGEIISRYAELGGAVMSIGSDAHRPEDVGADLGTAVELLVESGIAQAVVFEERVPRMVPLG